MPPSLLTGGTHDPNVCDLIPLVDPQLGAVGPRVHSVLYIVDAEVGEERPMPPKLDGVF